MRIGLTARGSTVDEIVDHAKAAETDGFNSIWFSSTTMGDPLVTLAIVGRETASIELGTSVLQTSGYIVAPYLRSSRRDAWLAGRDDVGIATANMELIVGVVAADQRSGVTPDQSDSERRSPSS